MSSEMAFKVAHDQGDHQICGGCGNCLVCFGCDGSEYETMDSQPGEYI